MNPYLKTIEDLLLRHNELTPENKQALLKAIADADKQWTITEFKLDRTEKVKKTTAVLLEETIEELEQKRKAVEAQNRELEIETALERVRSVAMGMKEPADMLDVCKAISSQLESLQVKEIRNVQTAVFDESKGIYTNYEFYAKHDKLLITETEFRNHPIAETFANQMLKGPNEVFIHGFKGNEVRDWLNYQKSTNVFIDTYLETADSLIYYWYSLGPVALGISTYAPLNEEEINLFKRFRNVFELAYRRYIDIEQAQAQARESQIQLALERVRARTMAMRKSDELSEAVYLLFQQFRELGENPEQATIGVINEKENVIEYWVTMYGNQMNKEFKFSIDEPHVTNKIYNAWKEGRKSLVIDLSGEALSEFMAYRAGKGGAAVNPNEKRRIINVAFFSKGLLNVQSNEQRSGESIRLLERFAAVFEQTYTRFLDLQKAEAQAREAQIELALERVRARTMAMQKSDELQEVVHTVFERLKDLNVELYTAIIVIFTEGSKDIVWWMQNKVNQQYSKILIRYADIPYLRHLFEAREKGEEIFSKCYINGEKNELYDYLFEYTDLRQVPTEQKKFLEENEFAAISVALARNIGIHITSYSKKSFSDGENEILKRFAKVFDQAYTRFLDLQKAEAQAREAQIEAALERVRSKAMAMHKSEDLSPAVATVFEELDKLNVGMSRCGLGIINEEHRSANAWITSIGDRGTTVQISGEESMDLHPLLQGVFDAWLKHQDFSYVLEGDDMKKYYRTSGMGNVRLPESQLILSGDNLKRQFYHIATFEAGGLFAFRETLFPEEAKTVMKRFANVFNLTYKRFLDIQKAEAQAREAKIEAALEKIRARTMAMQKSDELPEAANLLFQQIQSLGMPAFAAGYCIWDDDKQAITLWMSSEGILQPPFKAPTTEDELFIQMRKGYEEGKSLHVVEMGGEELVAHYQYMRTLPVVGDIFDSILKLGHSLPVFQVMHQAYFSKGFLLFITYEPVPESHEIFKRFASVFDQTYTRFLDLQKAEEQSRESQIQLALERVRARTMAMQRSEELSETAYVLFQQFTQLGENPIQITIGIIKEEEGMMEFRVTDWGGSGSKVNTGFNVSIDEPTLINKIFEAWKKNEKSIVIELRGKELEGWLKYRNKVSGINVKSTDTAGRRVISVAFFSKGMVAFSSPLPPSQESVSILERFAGVFDLTYTRFLDLKQAEEQAKESQIQLALERVRARTMAMQRSDELSETAAVLFDQLKHVGEHPERAFIGVVNEEENVIEIWATHHGGTQLNMTVKAPIDEPMVMNRMYVAWKEGKKSVVIDLRGDELEKYFQFLKNIGAPVSREIFGERRLENIAFFSKGMLGVITPDPQTEESIQLYERFAAVFDLTYTRFIDLKKAEEQAREAQIELALERVRARAMAMQKSDELKELIGMVFIELTKLDLVLTRCLIMIYDPKSNDSVWWMANSEAPADPIGLYVKNHEQPPYLAYIKSWKERNLKWQYILEGKVKKDWDDFLFVETELSHLPDFVIAGMKAPDRVYLNASFNSFGNLTLASLEPLSNEHFDIMLRFAKVFDLTYTRFNDLKQAEAQARESQIQLALERVRARTMAMQKSEEIQDATLVLFRQFKELGAITPQVSICIFDDEVKNGEMYLTLKGEKIDRSFIMELDKEVFVMEKAKKAFLDRQKNFSIAITGKNLQEYNRFRNSLVGMNRWEESNASLTQSWHVYGVFFSRGMLGISSGSPASKEAQKILDRFAAVFDLTYTRFSDLQKAEAQAREARIEAALEKVRSRTMAMHKSEELSHVIMVVSEQLQQLQFRFSNVSFIINNAEYDLHFWSAAPWQPQPFELHVPFLDHISVNNLREAQAKGLEFFTDILTPEENNQWIHHMIEHSVLKQAPDDIKNYLMSRGAYARSFALMKHITLVIGNYEGKPYTDEENSIFRRFANVFEQSYTRFLDLKKAEAQAREAKIEAALEKVRGKAMAMHNSNDLSVTASMVLTELRKLGITPMRCGVGLLNKESRKAQLYSASSSAEGDNLSLVGWVMLSGHPVLEKIHDTWLKNEEYYPELSGEQLKTYYESLLKGLPVKIPDSENGQKQYGTFLPFSVGCLYAWSDDRYDEDQTKILKRFATIIDLTFRRYLELQQSEANAREAVKQAALDRIRADIASMRTINDLDRITPLIWSELTILGIPFIRCGVFIMDESQKLIHTFLSTPDGNAIAAFHMPYDTPGNIAQVVSHWQDKKNYIDHWNEKAFTEFADTLVKQGALVSSEQYLQTIPQGGSYLHFLPFLQGMLYVGNTSPLSEDDIRLIQSVADAFSTAYARYEDFNKLEAAKKQVEKTLVVLKQAQQQLVQSEKMASLGELTAGIAHEIQNPLNFVNNFSEVSNELLDEMKTELEQGDADEAKAIAADVKQNLEKILFHGKRADAIVKGMLQHSRSSSGQKEETDLNILADEYLRLAYHGLRAKEKSFNAKFETDLDSNIGKVSIIPQDIGRVILNLINNAFYAVSEKRKQNLPGYEPTVTVTTKKLSDKVELRVVDNGDGIPQKVLDKIFQPFFTTKPTGQGTGLGLSLSYDIITKGHGGELKVETKEGEGSEFIIQLPVV